MKTEETLKKVKKYNEKYQMLSAGDIVVVGVSGGADSVCLLHILWELSKELGFWLLAVHVHHGVREDADQDAAYVEELCQQLAVPFFLKKTDMYAYAREKGLSPEEAGRQLRYQAFEEVLEGVVQPKEKYKIAVAHNKNDRVETMLFHLFRGSGLKGLCGIPPVREHIIRPLLCLERADIEAYLRERNIAFCIDSTNEEDTYTRNKIRHHILPYAEEQICKNAVAHMGETADILLETEDFLKKQTLLAYERCHIEAAAETIALDVFRTEDPFLQKRILLRCLEQVTVHRKDITKEHVEAILALAYKDGSKELSLPYGLTACKEYDRLSFLQKKDTADKAAKCRKGKETGQETEKMEISVYIPGEIEVPGIGTMEFQCLSGDTFFCKKGQIIPEKTYTKWFDYDKITKSLVIRTRKTGDYLTIDKNMRKQSVKDYMMNEKIPKGERNQLFLLADGEHILWIPGYRISQYYKVDENTRRILQVRIRGGR